MIAGDIELIGYCTNDQNKEIIYSKNRVALCHQTLGLTREKNSFLHKQSTLCDPFFSQPFCIPSFYDL